MKGNDCEKVLSSMVQPKKQNWLNLNWKEPPCAGITLIRFYGYDLSLPLFAASTPVNTEVDGSKLCRNSRKTCNLFSASPFYS